MLSEERIILMTRMASYERGEGRENVKIGNYFYMLCNIEEFLEDLYKMDLLAFAREVLTYLAVMVGGYAVLTYIVCTWRYARAKKSLKCYYHNLKKLNSLYQDGQ